MTTSNQNKIFIVSAEISNTYPILDKLLEVNDEFQIASSFTTDSEFGNIPSSKYEYYISNDQLNLDYKNNALLCVDTDTITQNSIGIALDVWYNSNIIPMSIKAFNTIKESYYKDCLIVWIDNTINVKNCGYGQYKLQMIEIKYFMNNFDDYKKQMMYFNQNDDVDDIVKTIIEYVEGDNNKKTQLILENS